MNGNIFDLCMSIQLHVSFLFAFPSKADTPCDWNRFSFLSLCQHLGEHIPRKESDWVLWIVRLVGLLWCLAMRGDKGEVSDCDFCIVLILD
jgi:hypothetical protein